MKASGYLAMGGQIIDVTIVAAPIRRKKPIGKPMPDATRRANARRSRVRSAVEQVFAHEKGLMGLWSMLRHGGTGRPTLVAGLRADGLVAPWIIDGAMDGPAFRTYVAHLLVPELRPADVVVMDNLPAHKVAGVREAIRAAGASVLYLPPYSPDLNAIEQAFAKLKALLRKAAARTKQTLWAAIGRLVDAFGPNEGRNYPTNSGYECE